MSKNTSRRQFMQTTALAGAGFWVAGGVQAKESKSPNERLKFACVGLEGKGRSDSMDAGKHGDIVAICDVDEGILNNATGRPGFGKAEKYTDYRKLLDKHGKSLDGITVSTPDHTHAVAAVSAMKLGIHCFCQKPLTHSLQEARIMAEVAAEKNLATQMGNQGTFLRSLREGAAVLQSGALGKISEVHVWTNRPVWKQGTPRPKPAPAPSNLAWNLWLGPRPERPYAPGYHRFAWRGWWDFGTGALGDMACHTLNLPYMGLDLRDPVAVTTVATSGHNKDSYPDWCKIKFEFPARNGRGPVVMYWYDGNQKFATSKVPEKVTADMLDGEKPNRSGALVIGEKGKLYSPGDYGGSYKLLGLEKPKDIKYRQPDAKGGHFGEWVEGIRNASDPEKLPASNFQKYAGGLTETVLLGNLAVWGATDPGEGPRVEWDAKAQKVTNDSSGQYEELIRHKYRDGFTL